MRVVDVRDFCIPSGEDDYDELVAFADAMASVPQFDAIPVDVVDKIRAEIEELPITNTAVKLVTAVFDRYKLESQRCNVGSWNTGDFNTGDFNTGDRNTGNGNTGNWNTGNYNTGNWNAGDWNTGRGNIGDWNSGDCNTGNGNSGNGNTGSRNTGSRNNGNGNVGNWNSGNRNIGDWNIGDRNVGLFCTGTRNILMFDSETEWEFADWWRSEARKLLYQIPRNVVEWVDECDMSEEEKERHPTYKTTGGYLKVLDESESAQIWWDGLSEMEKETIYSLPNFDMEKFKKCIGIK